jgi:ribonuclease P protein component
MGTAFEADEVVGQVQHFQLGLQVLKQFVGSHERNSVVFQVHFTKRTHLFECRRETAYVLVPQFQIIHFQKISFLLKQTYFTRKDIFHLLALNHFRCCRFHIFQYLILLFNFVYFLVQIIEILYRFFQIFWIIYDIYRRIMFSQLHFTD